MSHPEAQKTLPCGCLRRHGYRCACSEEATLDSLPEPVASPLPVLESCAVQTPAHQHSSSTEGSKELHILVPQPRIGKEQNTSLLSPISSTGLIHVPSQSNLKDVCMDSSHGMCSSGPSTPSLLEAQEPLLASAEAGSEPQAPPDDVRAGMLWYMSSSLFFAAIGICSKFLGNWGYPVFEITFFRSIIIACLSLSALISAGESPWGNRKGLLLLRGTLGYGSITCFFTACTLLPIADANTFTFLAPLIVALLSPMILKERISSATVVTIPLCICGVLLITQPAFLFGKQHQHFSVLALSIGLLQPFFSATAKMSVRVLRTTESMNVVVLYLMMCTFVYSIIGCAFTWTSLVLPATTAEVALLLMQGLFGYGNQICITNGLSKAKAASVMCMQYFSIVFSQLAGMWFFGEFISFWGNVGMVVIVASMCIYMWVEARSKK